jgi:hypothetical protein
MTGTRTPFGLLALLVLAPPRDAPAAARARDGGTLRLAVLPEVRADRWGETPEGAVVRGLVAAPLCRVDASGRVQPLLASLQRSAEGVFIAPRAGARFSTGVPLGPAELAASWARALERSPAARAALGPVRDLTATLEQQSRARGGALLLPLAHPWTDLEVSLCHPALAPVLGEGGGGGIGPYAPDGAERGRAVPGFPEGRPHPEGFLLSPLARRAAQRALETHAAQVLLGDGGDAAAPALFATYLVSRPGVPPFPPLADPVLLIIRLPKMSGLPP